MISCFRRQATGVSVLGATVLVLAALTVPAQGAIVYTTITAPPPLTAPSLGYQANQTAEFGDLIQFAGTNRSLTSVTVLLDDWAFQADWPGVGTAAGWTFPITINLYQVNTAGPTPEPGALIATLTQTFTIPWRPTTPAYAATGLPFTITFNFAGITLPNQIIYGVAFNTETWGYHPIGAPGPYESLNFALSAVPPFIGTNPLPDTAYWNTATASNYADGGAAGVGIFRQDQGWAPYSGAVTFNADPAAGMGGTGYQVSYAANLNIGDSVVNVTNDGTNGGVIGAGTLGNLCANVYVFDPQEEEIGCCTCLVTPNGLNSLSVKSDLISNNLTPAVPTSITISLIASQPTADLTGNLTVCNPATGVVGNVQGNGLVAWGNTLEPTATPGTFNAVPAPFLSAGLSPSELAGVTSACNFIQADGTGYGICKSCRLGALGGAKQ